MPAFEEPPGRPGAQRPQPDIDEPADVGLQFRPVPDVLNHLERRRLQLGQGGHGRRDHRTRTAGPAHRIPAAGLVDPLQGLGHDLRERLVGIERGQEQCPDHVDVGLHGIAGLGRERVNGERDGGRVSRIDQGQLAAGPGDPPGHGRVLGLHRLDDEPRDPGGGELLEQVTDGLRLA